MINRFVDTITTDKIEGIISRKEILTLLDENRIDKRNLVLISISEPEHQGYVDEALTDEDVSGFKDVIRVKFWDVEDNLNMPMYPPISVETAKEIKEFIIKHKDDRFLIHCRAGQSRSAGVGLALECLLKYNGSLFEANQNYSPIKEHPRYYPNLTVRDRIINA